MANYPGSKKNIAQNITYVGDESVYAIIFETLGCGLIENGAISDDGGLGVSWNDEYEIYDCVTPAIINAVSGSGTCTDNAINYLIWVSGTTLTLGTTPADILSNQVAVARISCQAGDIVEIHQEFTIKDILAGIVDALENIFPSVVSSGITTEPDTDVSSDLDVKMNAGVFYIDMHQRVNSPEILSRTTPMVRHFKTSGAWDSDTSSDIDPANWNDGTDLDTVIPARYYKSLFILDEGVIHWVYPTEEFVTFNGALAGNIPAIPPGLSKLVKSTSVIMQGSATALPVAGNSAWQDQRPIIGAVGTGTAVTSHPDLTNLSFTASGHTLFTGYTSGSGAPGTTPTLIGQIYIDTTADAVYVSTDTASSADWKKAFIAGDGVDKDKITLVIDGNGSVIATGEKKAKVTAKLSGIITKVRMLSDVSTTTVVDIWKDTYANYPPTVADTITAAAKPTITAAVKSEDSTLTGWTKAVSSGDVFKFNVDSNDNATHLTLELFLDATGD